MKTLRLYCGRVRGESRLTFSASTESLEMRKAVLCFELRKAQPILASRNPTDLLALYWPSQIKDELSWNRAKTTVFHVLSFFSHTSLGGKCTVIISVTLQSRFIHKTIQFLQHNISNLCCKASKKRRRQNPNYVLYNKKAGRHASKVLTKVTW